MVVSRFACVFLAATVSASAQTLPARFITVEQGADELRADSALAAALGSQLIDAPEQLDYEPVIDTLLDDARTGKAAARAGGIVARVTPYAFVVAELRGAKIELLATCVSRSTGKTITNAYMVVPKSSFPGTVPPTLDQVLAHLKTLSDADHPARFVYHNKYSTSSYFLPSLLFRARRIFGYDHAANPAGVTMLAVDRNESTKSSDLIKAVAEQRSDRATISSVWNGPKAAFDPAGRNYAEFGSKVHFVQLPDDLPCDLLVATRKVDRATRDAISARLAQDRTAGATPGSDVAGWVPWANVEAEDARRALSDLRRQAAASALPVVVDVQPNPAAPVNEDLLDAARLAIRLSGTELVDRSQYFDYYKRSDIRWELGRTHDGAVKLVVRYQGFRLAGDEVTQEFEVSFQQPADLTRRLVTLVHSRMHRIRMVWLYNATAPTVLRDVDFDIEKRVPFQEIQWNELGRNDYSVQGTPRVATVDKDATFEIQLAAADFPKQPDNRALDFEPMGRRAYRVLLMRVTLERTLFRVLTIAFVLLLALGMAALAWDAWRWNRRPPGQAGRPRRANRAVGTASPSPVPLSSHAAAVDVALNAR